MTLSIWCMTVCLMEGSWSCAGNYAFVPMVREVCQATQNVRILALTATPGSDLVQVKTVIKNLRISHIEVCACRRFCAWRATMHHNAPCTDCGAGCVRCATRRTWTCASTCTAA